MSILLSAKVTNHRVAGGRQLRAVLDFHGGCRFRLSVGDGPIDGQHDRFSIGGGVCCKLKITAFNRPSIDNHLGGRFRDGHAGSQRKPPTNSCSVSAPPQLPSVSESEKRSDASAGRGDGNVAPQDGRRFVVEQRPRRRNIRRQKWDGDQAAADVIQVACREQVDVARDERGIALVGQGVAPRSRL